MADSKTKSPEETEQLLKQFREWIHSQPHLPQNLEERMMIRFLHSCYYDLEKAKSAAELFFTIRANSPDLVDKRDPLSPAMQKALSIVNLAQLRISANRNLWIWQLNDPGLEKYDYLQDARMFFLITDAWLLSQQALEDEDIVLMDTKDISLKIITKINLGIARRLAKYQEDAIPIRLKQIHIVNAPSFIDKIYGLIKPFLKQDMTNMIRISKINGSGKRNWFPTVYSRLCSSHFHEEDFNPTRKRRILLKDAYPTIEIWTTTAKIHFHTSKSDTLHKYLDKEDLPEDYGGTNGKMEDHMKDVLKIISEKRDLLIDDSLWRATKKSKNNNSAKDITFQSLSID